MTRNNWLYAWGLGSIAAGGASLLVPLYVVALGAGPSALGVLSAVAASAGAFGGYVWGRLADRTGRWRSLGSVALAGIVLALVGVAVSPGLPGIVLANGLLWFAFSAAMPVFTMLTLHDAPDAEQSRRIARLNRVHGYGWAGGLALGTVWTVAVDELLALSTLASQRAFLGLCVVVGAAGVVGAVRWLPGDENNPGPDGMGRTFELPVATTQVPFLPVRLFRRLQRISPHQFTDRFTPALARYFLAIALFFAGFGVFFAPVPAYLESVGYASEHIFLFFLLSALGSAVAYTASGEMVDRYDVPVLQSGALGVRAAALPAVALVHLGTLPFQFAVVAVLFTVIGLSWAVIVTAAVNHITDLTPEAIRGEALGVYTALSALAGGVGSLLGGYLAGTVGYVVAFALACAVVLTSTGVILWPKRTRVTG